MSPLTKGSVMNGKPGGNKSFQERQATVLYPSVPLLTVTVPLPTEVTETNKQNPKKVETRNWREKSISGGKGRQRVETI